MTFLRKRMIEDMEVRNFSPLSQTVYLHHVSLFARYFGKSPALLGPEEIRAYQVYLTNEKKLATSTLRVAGGALRFLYKVTLKKKWAMEEIPVPKKPQTLPVVMSPEEVAHFLECIRSLKHRTNLLTCYAAGLRISETVRLKIPDIDSKRMVLRVEQGKGHKDRLWAMAHNRSYVPGKVMCSGRRRNLRRQASGSDCPAHNYLPLNEAMSLSAGRK